tara:strand:+ start:759 stop:1313 length:555 start_codon:yes stop_codon:yes gene_type:complete
MLCDVLAALAGWPEQQRSSLDALAAATMAARCWIALAGCPLEDAPASVWSTQHGGWCRRRSSQGSGSAARRAPTRSWRWGGGWLAHPSPRSLLDAAPRVVRATHRSALASAGLSPEIPEDLYCLIKKAVSVRKHLDKFRQDKDAKFRLILIESRIHRVARYYKSVKALPPTFKYESATASTLVS